MAKRITIMLDDKISEKLRKMQSDVIAKENRNVSFSSMINQVLEKGLKK